MRADEFLARLQQVRDGKELVDLLVQASVVAPPMRCPFPPETGTRVAPMNNTTWVSAGTHARVGNVNRLSDSYYLEWSTGVEELIDKQKHDLYSLVYVYE